MSELIKPATATDEEVANAKVDGFRCDCPAGDATVCDACWTKRVEADFAEAEKRMVTLPPGFIQAAGIAEYMIQALDGEVPEFAQSFESVRRILELKAEIAAMKAEAMDLRHEWAQGYEEWSALKAERDTLKASNHEWISANAPGGWIDALRAEVARLEGLIVEFDCCGVGSRRRLDGVCTSPIHAEARAIKAR